jgi:hypothetical protein
VITDEYRAGWRAACAHLHDLFEEAAGFYGNAPGRAAITGTYRRAAAVALGEAEDPQVGLSAVGGPVKPSGPLTAEEATPDCVVPETVWAPGYSPAEKLASLHRQPHACDRPGCLVDHEEADRA